MDVKELFSGIAVVIDDETNIPNSAIWNICKNLEEGNIPIIKYEQIPDNDVIKTCRNCSFMVVDWEFISPQNILTDKDGESDELGGRIVIPSTLQEYNRTNSLNFLKEVLKQTFAPVFIMTGKPIYEIKTALIENYLYFNDKPNRILIKQKTELSSLEDIFNALLEWMKESPSVYVLKEWDNALSDAKHGMFSDMYNISHSWVNVLWDLFIKDSGDTGTHIYDFTEFLTKNLANRVICINFETKIMEKQYQLSNNEIKRVIEGERYIKYTNDKSQIAHTGDLFACPQQDNKNKITYFLNVSAQCDLSRKNTPKMICLKGHEMDEDELEVKPIKIMNTEELHIGKRKIKLTDLKEDEDFIKINTLLSNYRDKLFLTLNNEIIERASNVIIPCINDGKHLVFSLYPVQKDFNATMKEHRIGRLLPPYITRIQQKFSHYIVREGVMPVPPYVFD